jgi:hypothetical protein
MPAFEAPFRRLLRVADKRRRYQRTNLSDSSKPVMRRIGKLWAGNEKAAGDKPAATSKSVW